jgi:outer membrane protein assembly factor BamB
MSENLLIDGDNLICSPGGELASVIALNKKTGKVVWECKELRQQSSYCNPFVFDAEGNRVIVTMLRDSVVGLDARTGKLLWRDEFDEYHTDLARSVNANTPIYHNGRVYTTSGYNNGGAMLQLSADGTQARRIWTDATLDVHHGGVILIDGYLYGSNWTSNSRGDWVCLRWDDGRVMYETGWNGNKGSMIYADGMFYCYDERTGAVGLVEATPQAFKVTSSFKITKGKGPFWAHPSIADGRLYIRHGAYLMVYDIKAK